MWPEGTCDPKLKLPEAWHNYNKRSGRYSWICQTRRKEKEKVSVVIRSTRTEQETSITISKCISLCPKYSRPITQYFMFTRYFPPVDTLYGVDNFTPTNLHKFEIVLPRFKAKNINSEFCNISLLLWCQVHSQKF